MCCRHTTEGERLLAAAIGLVVAVFLLVALIIWRS
jgi:hypothetical protein